MKEKAAEFFVKLQNNICCALENLEGGKSFRADLWQRDDLRRQYGGGGDTRILQGGDIFEQAGVNFSKVHGTLPADMSYTLSGRNEETAFFASGTSVVIHPYSPMIPTTHANFRYLEVGENENKKAWFGGGMDLTPYYFFQDDAVHFHSVIKKCCDKHNPAYYPKFKKWCDKYFFLPHRKEARGIGGCFFDYLGRESQINDQSFFEKTFLFVQDIGNAFLEAYLPIVERRKNLAYQTAQKEFQLLRRGRYVEFNLIYDRGTLFGLKTGGRTESILMSLPPQVKWQYNDTQIYRPGTPEHELLVLLREPKEWL